MIHLRQLYIFLGLCLTYWLGNSRLQAQSIYFPPTTGTTWDTISPVSLGYCPENIDSLYNFLDVNNTKAFILLQDGKIVLEKYFGTHTATTPWQWASAGKTITAFMVGMAQQEGYLNIQDTTSQYLGNGWTDCTSAQEERITIRNQLTMTSGLDDGVPDHYCTLDTCLVYKADAGTRWAYHNGPYTLLDSVISVATGQSLNQYTTQKLKTPTGMTGSFVKVGYNNVYFSTARSMARFGLLMLNKGKWNTTPVMTDTTYFNELITPSQFLNLSYGYLWWLNGQSSFMVPTSQIVFPGMFSVNAPADMVAAIGSGGQFLNVIRSQNRVWLRMGDDPGNSAVPFLLNDDIWEYINRLPCTVSSDKELNTQASVVKMYPNPGKTDLYYQVARGLKRVGIMNVQGQEVASDWNNSEIGSLDVSGLVSGVYCVQFYFQDGQMISERWVKN